MMGAVYHDKGLKPPDQILGLVLHDEYGRLDSVNQKLQLRQLKGPCDKVISDQVAVLTLDDIQTIVFQRFKIGVQGLEVRGRVLAL